MKMNSIANVPVVVALLVALFLAGEVAAVWTTRTTHGGRSPRQWGGIYTGCLGQQQSPIDITTPVVDWNLRPLHLNSPTVTNFTVQAVPKRLLRVHPNDARGVLFDNNAGGAEYTLEYIDIVSPSEHEISGTCYDAEIQLVHTLASARGNLAPPRYITSILLHATDSSYNFALEPLLMVAAENATYVAEQLANATASFERAMQDAAGGDGSGAVHPFVEDELCTSAGAWNMTLRRSLDLNLLCGVTRDYFTYRGSLTRPPCQEDVTWAIFTDPSPIGTAQLTALRTLIGLNNTMDSNGAAMSDGNNRPVIDTMKTSYPTAIVDDEPTPVLVGTPNGKSRRMTYTEIRNVRRFVDIVGDDVLLAKPGTHYANELSIDFAWASLGLTLVSLIVSVITWRIAYA